MDREEIRKVLIEARYQFKTTIKHYVPKSTMWNIFVEIGNLLTIGEYLLSEVDRLEARVKELEEGIRKLSGLLSLDEVEYTTEYWGFTRTPLKREALEELYKLLEGKP